MPFLVTQYSEKEGAFAPAQGAASPQWFAYTSDETGRDEVYVGSLPASGKKIRISVDGGSRPRWRKDGKELFYLATDGSIMGVSISLAGSSLRAEPPAVLCRPTLATPLSPIDRRFEVTNDGQRSSF